MQGRVCYTEGRASPVSPVSHAEGNGCLPSHASARSFNLTPSTVSGTRVLTLVLANQE